VNIQSYITDVLIIKHSDKTKYSNIFFCGGVIPLGSTTPTVVGPEKEQHGIKKVL